MFLKRFAHRNTTLGFALLGGALVGLTGLSLALWPLAWLGIAVSSYAMAREPRRWRALLGFAVGALLQRALWLSWSFSMAKAMMPGEPSSYQAFIAVGFMLVTALPVLFSVGLCLLLLKGRLPVWSFLPVAWALGERAQAVWTSVATDWLFSQVDVPPVMGLLSQVGMVPATILCLTAAAWAGEALAERRARFAVLAGLLLAGIALVPAPPPGDLRKLEGVGAVHMTSMFETPYLDGIDPPLDLVVWPETILAAHPLVTDNALGQMRLSSFDGKSTDHLVGAVTLSLRGAQNSLLHLSPHGFVTQMRAKHVLFPVFERAFLGIGRDWLSPGDSVPMMELAGRTILPLVCGEFFTRELVEEGAHAGASLLVVSANDRYQAHTAQASWQVLTHLRMRAIEFGIPAVYSSLEGQAAFVGSDGRVLARSAADAPSGILTWSATSGASDHTPAFEPRVAVLYDPAVTHLRPDCPPGHCRFFSLSDVPAEAPHFDTVIVSAHGTSTTIGGRSAEEVAAAATAFSPDLVVLDACFSAFTPLLSAFAAKSHALVVATPFFVDGGGMIYDPPLFGHDAPERRALAVNTSPPSKLYVGRPGVEELAAAEAEVAAASGDELRPRIQSWQPTLVEHVLAGGERVLVPVDWEKIGRPPEAKPMPSPDQARHFEVRALWFDGPEASHRDEVDSFLECLIEGSNFAEFFRGKAQFSYAGSSVVEPKEDADRDNRSHWLEPIAEQLPVVAEGKTPLYLVFAGAAQVGLRSACGYHQPAAVGHREAALALVRTSPPCWPGVPSIRSHTQIAMHEIAEAADLLIGHRGCVADGQCEAGGGCERRCDAFTGLACPGAPERTTTGCDGVSVEGWAIQRLAHKGWEDSDCSPCVPCDFTVELTPGWKPQSSL